jgi:hypothetical protein
MAAHRYWSLLCKGAPTQAYHIISELGLYQLSGSTRLVGTPIASSYVDYSTTPANAFDEVSSTGWYASLPDSWVGLDFGGPQVVIAYSIGVGSVASYAPPQFNLRWSDDGVTWTDVDTRSGVTWVNQETKTFTVGPAVVVPKEHRYWRAVGLEAYGTGDLELSCFHLLDAGGVRLDAPATLTSNFVPSTGLVANLQDDDLTTGVRWPAQSVATLTLNWDFGGSLIDVGTIQVAGNSQLRFLLIAKLQFSDDAISWTDRAVYSAIAWQGIGTKSKLAVTTATGELSYWNPADMRGMTLSTDQKTATGTADTHYVRGSSAGLSGKRQFECVVGGNTLCALGVAVPNAPPATVGFSADSWVLLLYSPALYHNSVNQGTYGDGMPIGTVIGVVFDTVARTLEFYKDGVSKGVAFSNIPLGVAPTFGPHDSGAKTATLRVSDFVYPVPGAGSWPGELASISNIVLTTLVRAADTPVIVGATPTIIYGIPQFSETVTLTVQSGSVKDYITGVLGTGRGRVTGTVKVKGTPDAAVYRKVRLVRERDGLVVRELWSDPVTGAYDFKYIDELQLWTVLSNDYTGAFRAVVADGQIPEMMP